MCCTALHFRANSKHLNPPLQTHLPPQSTSSHTNNNTHTSATQPPRPGADLICWVQPEPSALHLSFIHMMSHRAAALFCEPGAGKFLSAEGEDAATRGTGVWGENDADALVMCFRVDWNKEQVILFISCMQCYGDPERTWRKVSYLYTFLCHNPICVILRNI